MMEEKIIKENANKSIQCTDTMNKKAPCTTRSVVNLVCPHGHHQVKQNGEQTCVPNDDDDGHCIINDSWNNVTTFDGYNYRFNNHDDDIKIGNGRLCNRVLAKDCHENRRFSLHLMHRYSERRNESVKYRGASLLLRVGETRILLSHHETVCRIRVNHKPAQLPYIHMGQFSIVKNKEKNHILLHALIGINIYWQPNRSVEIHLKSRFRGHICGLCGDFNGDPSNDEHQPKDITKGCQKKWAKSLKNHQQGESFLKQSCQPQLRDSVRRFCDRIMRRNKQQLQCRPKDLRKAYEQCLRQVCHCYGDHGDDRQCLCYAMQHFLDYCHMTSIGIDRISESSELRIPMCKCELISY